ncbi:MAG: hypothetical protein N2110_02900 [Flavobacteriales bacterium]|nr:hypothetical protein [Flavobacteriales bacterium]
MKKHILKIATLAVAGFVGFSSITLTSCSKTKGCKVEKDDKYDPSADEADNTKCDPTGTVNKFVGIYNGSESCTSGNDTYSLEIEAGTSEYTIKIKNLYNAGATFVINANVSQKNITIPNQTVSGITVNGSGSLNGNSLSLTFSLSGAAGSDNCTFTGSK